MPCDLYDLNASYYGSEAQLRALVAELRARKIKPVADVVLNHRCASRQGPEGVYNLFGGRLDWDATAIVSDDDRFAGRGSTAKKDLGHAFFEAAPNIDHGNARVKRDMTNWINWLRHDVGFEGWRLDFVRGFCGSHVHDYVNASNARFVVGEFWDGLQYSGDGRPSKCQDAHRERIVRWINAAGGQACAFDITTKGILHAVLDGSGEYWRLRDVHGRAPGLIGLWPSRAVTFVENHDTGSTQGHWRFPSSRVAQGYAYILTHPGTPCVFYDHAFLWEDLREAISSLIAIRKRAKIHCRSVLRILAAEQGLYAAEVDSRLTVKLGPKSWQPEAGWTLSAWGDQWAVWERTNFNL